MSFVAQKIAQNTRKRGGPSSRARANGVAVLTKATDLLDLIGEKDAAAAVGVLRDGLKAEKTFWDRETEAWITQPDFKERREAGLSILAYKFGKPIERQITATGTFQELSDIIARISASPMAMEKLGHLVPSAGHATNPEQQSEKLDSDRGTKN